MIVVTLVFQVGIAIVLALMVDNIRRGAKFFRIVYFFPIVVSATALGLLFNLIFLYDKGMLNQLLEFLGYRGDLIDWKAGGRALVTMMIPVTWQYVGFYFVILVTGLNNISEELYESAAIDGATKLQRVRYISLPLLHNVICTGAGCHGSFEGFRPSLGYVSERNACGKDLAHRNLYVLQYHAVPGCGLQLCHRPCDRGAGCAPLQGGQCGI